MAGVYQNFVCQEKNQGCPSKLKECRDEITSPSSVFYRTYAFGCSTRRERGSRPSCSQTYCAGANERNNEVMRQTRKSYKTILLAPLEVSQAVRQYCRSPIHRSYIFWPRRSDSGLRPIRLSRRLKSRILFFPPPARWPPRFYTNDCFAIHALKRPARFVSKLFSDFFPS